MFVRDLAAADAACGGKAAGLARLLAAGLPVPPGFVLEGALFSALVGAIEVTDEGAIGHTLGAAAATLATAALPAEVAADISARAAALGVLAVRSSATIEDGAAGAAAGVFSSQRAVPAADAERAIRAVWTSALTPLAAAYARRRGAAITIGVIVQRFEPGALTTIYTRPPGAPTDDVALVQRDEVLTRHPRPATTSAHPAAASDGPATGTARAAADHDSATTALITLALAAETAIGAVQGADVEVITGADGTPWIVQARPIVHPAPAAPRRPPPPPLFAHLIADGRRWTWDVAHNPDPLSPAQAELVERVEAAGVAPWSLRLCAGYLYTAARPAPAPAPRITTMAALAAEATRLEGALARILDGAPTSLDDALARYLAFYAVWAGELSPLITAARAAAPAATSARPSSVEAALIAAARGTRTLDDVLAELGPLAPAWDVAAPTYAEQPGLVRAAITRTAAWLAVEPGPTATADPLAADPLAALAADLAERDDRWFARAQAQVRSAVLATAARRGIAPSDACWLTFDELARLTPDEARRRAAGAQAAAARAALWAMPVEIGGPPAPTRAPLRGIGTGPRVTGRVVRFASLAAAVAVAPGDIVVTRAVTPALAVLVVGCAALVSETGGLLDHGAALARELGIPCVVACHEAWSRLDSGTVVTVDGDAGTVIPHAAPG